MKEVKSERSKAKFGACMEIIQLIIFHNREIFPVWLPVTFGQKMRSSATRQRLLSGVKKWCQIDIGFHRYLCLGSSNKKRYFSLRMPPSSLVLSPGESGIIEVMIFPWSQHLFDLFYTTLFSISSLLLSQVLENTNITIICQAEGGRPPAKVGFFPLCLLLSYHHSLSWTRLWPPLTSP